MVGRQSVPQGGTEFMATAMSLCMRARHSTAFLCFLILDFDAFLRFTYALL